MRIVCLSDTHGKHREVTVPEGDLLVITGDLTNHGEDEQVADLDAWLGTLPHRHKVIIAGNHDFNFEAEPKTRALVRNAIYLEDEGVVLDGVHIWGSPWSPRFFDWAFNVDRGAKAAEKWAMIPPGTDVLLTHGPPMGILDRTFRGLDVGCEALREAVARLRPQLHVFGHIHEGYGTHEEYGTLFVNPATCTLRYRPTQAPIVIELGDNGARPLIGHMT